MTSMQLSEVSFEEFVGMAEPRLRHALVAAVGRDRGREATAEALAYGWEHWGDLRVMANPVGYLYRVGRSRVRVRRHRFEFAPAAMHDVAIAGSARMPEFEPGLPDALARLSERQRVAVFLVYAMDWTRRDVADLLGISVHSVGSHLDRGLDKLRKQLGVNVRG
jgi:RNA polymerase sigma factor (sigma-70 family)